MDRDDLKNRFTYHQPKPGQPGLYQDLRAAAHHLAEKMNASVDDCREKSLAITALEESVMWINVAIARH